MKQCSVCKLTKAKAEFNRKRERTDGLQSHCRDCSHKLFANYYRLNKPKQLRVVKLSKKRQRAANQELVLAHFRTHPCVDCKETDPVVLEFDHVRGVKHKSISRMLTDYSRVKLELEIQKCEVRCSNCHRRVTYQRAGSYRSFWGL